MCSSDLGNIGYYSGIFQINADGTAKTDTNGNYISATSVVTGVSKAFTNLPVTLGQSTSLSGPVFTAATPSGSLTVSYDYSSQSLKFTDSKANSVLKVSSGNASKNSVLGMPVAPIQVDDNGLVGTKVIPNGTSIRAAALQQIGRAHV